MRALSTFTFSLSSFTSSTSKSLRRWYATPLSIWSLRVGRVRLTFQMPHTLLRLGISR